VVIVEEHAGEIVRINWGGKVFKLELGPSDGVEHGVMEICRLLRQPKPEAVYSFTFEQRRYYAVKYPARQYFVEPENRYTPGRGVTQPPAYDILAVDGEGLTKLDIRSEALLQAAKRGEH
jgi:hypothetical protein